MNQTLRWEGAPIENWKICPNCGEQTYRQPELVGSSWQEIWDQTYPLHTWKEYPAVILTDEGWYCRVCKHTWEDDELMSKETSSLKALKEALEEAETQADETFAEVKRALYEAHPNIQELFVDPLFKAWNDREEAIAPARKAYSEAKVEAETQAVHQKLEAHLRELGVKEAEG